MEPYPKFFKEAAELRGVYDDTESDVNSIAAILDDHGAKRILDIPCGFGRISGPLVQRGFDVTAVDLSADQLELAKKLNPGPDYQIGNMSDPPLQNYDALLNIYTSFGYLPDEQSDFKCLLAWRKALREGGLLILETLDIERVNAIDDQERHLQQEDGSFHRTTGPLTEYIYTDPTTHIMSIDYNLAGEQFTSRTRLYHRNDLVGLLKQAGFNDIQIFSDFDRRPAFLASPIVICAKA